MFAKSLGPLAALALRHRLPTIFFGLQFPAAGGLMAYGPDGTYLWQRAGALVSKILKDARPADLPIEQADRFRFNRQPQHPPKHSVSLSRRQYWGGRTKSSSRACATNVATSREQPLASPGVLTRPTTGRSGAASAARLLARRRLSRHWRCTARLRSAVESV